MRGSVGADDNREFGDWEGFWARVESGRDMAHEGVDSATTSGARGGLEIGVWSGGGGGGLCRWGGMEWGRFLGLGPGGD